MYVVLEGIDTAGKSTQIMRLKEIFTNAIFTCEPGGSALGMKIREILLHTSLCQKAEMLLFLADRAEPRLALYFCALEPGSVGAVHGAALVAF